jgi:hypothetical protein
VLETTLSMAFTPGTNLKEHVVDANWTFLLPNRDLKRVVYVGPSSISTLVGLSRVSRTVMVVGNYKEMEAINCLIKQLRLPNLHAFVCEGNLGLPVAKESVDLITIGDRFLPQFLNPGGKELNELIPILRPDGLVYLEIRGPVRSTVGTELQRRLAGNLGTCDLLWMAPVGGQVQTVIPLENREVLRYFLQRKIYCSTFSLPVLRQNGWFFNRKDHPTVNNNSLKSHYPRNSPKRLPKSKRIISRRTVYSLLNVIESIERIFLSRSQLAWRLGLLARKSPSNAISHPPKYLVSIAQEAGIDISDYRWALSAPSDYSSRKLLFFLFEPEQKAPKWLANYVVKMVRESKFNSRLENENRSLTAMHEMDFIGHDALPQPVFFGYHNESAILGETAVEGSPLREHTEGNADCPYAASAVNWLINLSEATADPTVATPTHTADALFQLLDKFEKIYGVSPRQHQFLCDQITKISDCEDPFPSVFQHGDPGTWNTLVTPKGRIVFLDWESSELKGMPLWDIFYFIRSFSLDVARSNGIHDSLKGFSEQFIGRTVFNQWLDKVTSDYCLRVNLPDKLVEPLFYTCWMHRALKESTRLSPSSLENGHYLKLLRLCINERENLFFANI